MNEQPKFEVLEEKFRDFFVSAKEHKGMIDIQDVNTLISELNLDNHQIDKIYEKLEADNIVVFNNSDEEDPNADMLLEIEDSADDMEEADKTDYSLASSGSDDPVHLYLKEIGNYPLLSTDDEVELSKRIEQGDEEAKNFLLN